MCGRVAGAVAMRSYSPDASSTLLGPPLQVQPSDLHRGLDLFQHEERLGAFDAVLAATATRVGAAAIVSADRGFAGIGELTHLDPSAPGVIEALRSLGGSRDG